MWWIILWVVGYLMVAVAMMGFLLQKEKGEPHEKTIYAVLALMWPFFVVFLNVATLLAIIGELFKRIGGK